MADVIQIKTFNATAIRLGSDYDCAVTVSIPAAAFGMVGEYVFPKNYFAEQLHFFIKAGQSLKYSICQLLKKTISRNTAKAARFLQYSFDKAQRIALRPRQVWRL